ncbi:hypothetical protein U0070_000129, partial [Myodes glareolus]
TACKAKQEYDIVRIHVCCDGLKCPFPQGPSYGKPGHDGVNHLAFAEACSLDLSHKAIRRHLTPKASLKSTSTGSSWADTCGSQVHLLVDDSHHAAWGRTVFSSSAVTESRGNGCTPLLSAFSTPTLLPLHPRRCCSLASESCVFHREALPKSSPPEGPQGCAKPASSLQGIESQVLCHIALPHSLTAWLSILWMDSPLATADATYKEMRTA